VRTQNNVLPEDILIPYFGKDSALVGIEVGVSTAVGSLGMLWRMPNLKLYCIDPWEHRDLEPYEANLAQEVHDGAYAEALNRLSPYTDRVVVLRNRSDDAVDLTPEQVDFIFIDGHHEYSQVVKDIKNYAPKVRKGGLICGHDYGQVPDVTRAVQEVYPINDIKTGEDFIWWVVS